MEFEYGLIEKIKQRPELFLREASITKLKTFLDGYTFAINEHNIEDSKTIMPLPFWFFHEYVARVYNYYESTSGYLNMILKQVNNEKEGLELFFKLFDEFKNLKFEEIFVCKLNKENIDFHNNSKYTPKLVSGKNYDILKPLYQNVKEIYYAKIASNTWYIGFIKKENEYELIKEIYKSKEDIINYMENCFGNSLDWKKQDQENINFEGKRIL